MTIEFIRCDDCDHEVAMVLNHQGARVELACNCHRKSFPMTECWIGDLPPGDQLPVAWHRQNRDAETDRPSVSECSP